MSALGSRFDWYSMTFEHLDPSCVAPHIALSLGGMTSTGKGRLGYARCAVVERDGQVLAQVFTGSPRPGEVHVAVSGDACDELVPLLRRLWPNHRVARADSAIDFAADFSVLDDRALAFAKDRRLAYRLVTDSEGGATRYLGSPSSAVMVRVYKKSEQLRKIHPEQAESVPDGIVRAELQVRPGSKLKGSVARMEPDALWGLGQWSQAFAASFLDIDAERVSVNVWRPSDFSRSMFWMGHAYGPVLARRVEQVGIEQARVEALDALGLGEPSAGHMEAPEDRARRQGPTEWDAPARVPLGAPRLA